MQSVAIVAVGRLKERWERDACAEYVKRLSRFCDLQIREVEDQPEPAKPSDALNRAVMDKEGAAILSCLKAGDRVVALCVEGKSMSSEEFAEKIASWSGDGRRLALVIGGSLGLSEAVTARADMKLSFSKMTFPHQLMRVILLEQLYRAFKIDAGERYHK